MAKFSHILVTHQYEAEDILKLLAKGRPFDELARRFSNCPSAAHGGDLGDIKPGRADEEFEDAAFALKPGHYSSKPVRTKFGYHIILRRD
jgi:peptidylprolyl isomerase/peptidyl-prolyl cis-trans isomerase C